MLAELFFSIAKGNQKIFREKFDQILSEVPNSIGNTENFWIYFFLGAILTLPDTKLMSELDIKKIEISVSDDQKTIDLRITVGDKVIYRSVKAETRQVPVIECEDVNLPHGSEFVEISKISADCHLSYIDEESIKEIFQRLMEVCNHHKNQSFRLKRKLEALSQAFIYGFFKINTEYDCLIEFNAGLGTADLVIKFKDVSVVVECKADNTTAEKAIQQIKNKGYFYLDVLDKLKSTILVGINFDQEDLMVEKCEIFEPEGLLNVLMDDEIEEGELEEAIQKELKFLCYTKNIGICNPDNPSNHNEADPKNKYVGSFTALVLGQILQYRSQECDCECTIMKTSETKMQSVEFTIADKLQLSITEFADKGGNISPKHDTSSSEGENSPKHKDQEGKYNIKVIVTKDDKELIYKIKFPDKNSNKVKVCVEQDDSCAPRARRTSDRSVKDHNYGYKGFSSTESSSSLYESISLKKVNIEKLIEEIENGNTDYLQQVINSCKDFIYSEANLQLLLKGIFKNAKIDDKQIVAEIEFITGQAGKIDLLLKLPSGEGIIIIECKFCIEEKSISKTKEEAWEQLHKYTDKGNLKYILNSGKLTAAVIVFCAKSADCIVEVKSIGISEASSCYLNDSGFVSCEDLSSPLDLSIPKTSLTPSTSLMYLHNTPPPSPSVKRKVLSP